MLELAGVPALVPVGLDCLRIGGTLIEIGCVFPGAAAEVDLSSLLRRVLTVRGLHNYAFEHLAKAVALMAEGAGRYPFAEIVGKRFPLERINEAMRAAEAGEALRVAVTFP
ncbi:MAG: zinc-binding dehydrogenase [Planctomycetota bacterium]